VRYVSLLVKPSSSLCNMRCRYCFYADESEHRETKSMGIMTDETMERLIGAAFAACDDGGALSFSFQGGEPTVAGLPFFERFVRLVRERNTRSLPVSWAIQTNGLALNGEWAAFFKKERFLVGVSIDGDRALHDRMRPDAGGAGTFERVAGNFRLLRDAGVDVNILCVVNGETAERPREVYRALRSLKTDFIQFIPCLDPLETERGAMPWSLTPEKYGRFLKETFDEWYNDWASGRYVSVRQFDDYVHNLMGMPPSSCAASGQCGTYLVAEADGSLYPCDFYALDEWKLGMAEDGLDRLMDGRLMRAFRHRAERKPKECARCRYFPVCRGGCPRDWVRHGDQPHNYYCAPLKAFFDHAAERLMRIARAELTHMGRF